MQRTRKQTNYPRGRTNSPRGRTHLGAASPPVTRSPLRGADQAGSYFDPLADDLATDETELVDDVSLPPGGGYLLVHMVRKVVPSFRLSRL